MGMEAKLEPTPPPVRFSVLQISANDSPTVLNLKGFGERMTVLKGAAGGAVGGTGMMLGEVIMDPQTIILLPIMVPAVAIAGAASAPSNAEWEAMVASQNRATREIARLSALIDSMDKGADLERRIAQRIKAVPDFSSTCISIRGQRRRCPASDGAAKLRIELDNEVSPYLGPGRLFRGNKNQKIEAYFSTRRREYVWIWRRRKKTAAIRSRSPTRSRPENWAACSRVKQWKRLSAVDIRTWRRF